MKCRINNLTKLPAYTPYGIRSIRLLDHDDFNNLRFDHGSGRICNILHEGEFIELETSQTAKYLLSQQNGEYTHSLETFLGVLNGTALSALHLAAKNRRYVVLFETNDNRRFLFGHDSGARLTYTSQTDEASGSAIKLNAVSPYPLLEVISDAATFEGSNPEAVYIPDETGAICESGSNETTGTLQYIYMMKVSAKKGAPLDIDGNLCSRSGAPQAYRKLSGAGNLNGNYCLESTYSARGEINGTLTYIFAPTLCPIHTDGSISIAPQQISVYSDNSEEVLLTSSGSWAAESLCGEIASLDITSGMAGNYRLKITGKKTGSCSFIFTNIQTAINTTLEVNCLISEWILQHAAWNDKGKWMDTALWNN